ncbi:MAG: lytic transglycosylase domain-containing protein [Acidobacteria bacterium]|nr:lytic transglycosylase domain-containing protein [Acidobacteriota bacterium]
MNQNFMTYFQVHRRIALRLNAFFLILLFASLPSLNFGQTTVLTRTQFSRISVIERARFFEPTISRIAAEEGVDPYLLWTIAYNETRFRPWLVSPAGAQGLMQFIPATAVRFNLPNPYQPEPAIKAAARYVRFLQNRFGGRIDSILAGYNAGEGAVDAFLTGRTIRAGKKIINRRGIKTIGGVPPYRETVAYVARGLVVYRLLRMRQIFPGSFVSSVYPSAVSLSVARVWLKDPEIGFNGSLLTNIGGFNNEIAKQSNYASLQSTGQITRATNSTDLQTNMSIPSTETVSKNLTGEIPNEERPNKESNEVFYEPRTGNRFKASNGRMERLEESGELIIGEPIRSIQPDEIRARGTFFGSKKEALK